MSDPIGRSSEQYEQQEAYAAAIAAISELANDHQLDIELANKLIAMLEDEQRAEWEA